MKISGAATIDGTARYRKRFDGKIPVEHFRQAQLLWMSSIGIGTYLGNYDDATDQEYHQAVVRAVESGCNVIDSAINYRLQRSERSIGTALKELATNGYNRDEIVVATKGGFIPYDGVPPKDPRGYIEQTVFKSGLAVPSDVVSGCHCMTPKYLLNQLDGSLRNLDLESIDIYYLHNPETQLGKITAEEFDRRLVKAFEALEGAVDAGKIRMYGAATWNCFRNPVDAKDYLALAHVIGLAEKAGGKNHRFKVIQLPLNLGMSEALSSQNQPLHGHPHTLLEAAQEFGLTVMCSASVLQGQLTRNLPPIIQETFTGLHTDAQRALQFVRSTPGVTTALVGMKQQKHVEENLATARIAPASWEQYSKLFQANEP
ncbi:MAG TPA: aldo/keto reductase, partial [Candidatus Limnocylindrales bacterium]|nr:aldo/keto reductase [Candidatus Limnocylindrales bacterium]